MVPLPHLCSLNMAATSASNRPPSAQSGPNDGNPHGNGPLSGQQDIGFQSAIQDPGSSTHPEHHVSARQIVYVPAPPPPPFLQYQWPMPFSYNPFASFPGMGE